MKKITKQKWVNALRSGKFKQGRGILCVNDKYCCLGVLAKITGNLTKPNDGLTTAFGFGKNGKVHNYHVIPAKNDCEINIRKFGLLEKDMSDLIEKNDGYDLSFPEIADWIEENVETED